MQAALQSVLGGQGNTIMDGLKSKFEELNMEDLPMPVKRRVSALRGIQNKHNELEAECRREIEKLERRYMSLYQPLYEQRAAIVRGQYEPKASEVSIQVSEEEERASAAEAPIVGIPGFWLKALQNHYALQRLISEQDEPALEALENIQVVFPDPESPAYQLIFEFAPNPYFHNKTLAKSYLFTREEQHPYEFEFDHAEGETIQWKSGQNLTMKTVTKTQRHKTKNTTRTVTREEPTPSFFNFFSPPQEPKKEAGSTKAEAETETEGPEMDADAEEAEEAFVEAWTMDYGIGQTLRSCILPDAVNWFLGLAKDYDEEDEFEDDYDEEEDEDEDEAGGDSEDPYEPEGEGEACCDHDHDHGHSHRAGQHGHRHRRSGQAQMQASQPRGQRSSGRKSASGPQEGGPSGAQQCAQQ